MRKGSDSDHNPANEGMGPTLTREENRDLGATVAGSAGGTAPVALRIL